MLKFNRRNKRLVIPVGINPNYGIDSSTVYNTGDANITPSDVLEGKVGYGKDGKIIGTLDIQSEKEESYQEGYEFGYLTGSEEGFENGIEDQKSKLESITITENGTYNREDGYNEVIVEIAGSAGGDNAGFDFSVIGYNENESNIVNRSISDDIAYSKQLMDAWDPSRTTAQSYFFNKPKLVYAPKIDTSNVTNMRQMFYLSSHLTSVPLFDTSNVNTMYYMFGGCSSLTSVPLFNTSNVNDMSYMFWNCTLLTSVSLFDTLNVNDMGYMFYSCSSLTSVPLFNTSNVTDMSGMFYSCSSLTSVPLFNTSNVTDMRYMFYGCTSLTSVPAFDTSKVTGMGGMFQGCMSLTSVPELNCQSIVTDMTNMFDECWLLTDVGGFKNLGMSFTGSSDNGPTLISADGLTRQSCLNIFNTVYDMNLNTSYTGTPTIQLPSSAMYSLSSDDIAIATAKGWTVQAG